MEEKKVFKIFEIHKIIDETHKNYASFKEKLLKIIELNKEVEKVEHQLDKEVKSVFTDDDHPYTYKKIRLSGGCVMIDFKADLYYEDMKSLKNELENKIKQEKNKVQFRNLNDLNAAKFLTDDEKREILGYELKEINNKTKEKENEQ